MVLDGFWVRLDLVCNQESPSSRDVAGGTIETKGLKGEGWHETL